MSEVDAAVQEPEVEVNPLADLVDAALAQDYNKANEIFGQAISVKLDDVMDQERIRLANSIYNASEEDDEDEIEDEDIDKKMREIPLEVENRDQRECMTINQKLQSIKESTEKKNPVKGARIGLSTDKTLKVTIENTDEREIK